MSGQSLGLIETVGLTVAVEAADAAMKSANVELVGYELTKGGGLVTVKFTGEVGAINAAVAAGVAAGKRVGNVYAWKVIARTATGIDSLIASQETCGVALQKPVELALVETPSATEHKEQAIPVVNIEPVAELSSCVEWNDEVVADKPVEMPSTLAEEQRPQNTLTEKVEQPVAPIAEEPVKPIAQDEKKTLRVRAKSPRK
ncbi:BMC domain-containing protein [Rahnella sp. SAP-1]|uniref:BMC domain-containing protein n=1 Tax=Rouxiella aceris TaxID=2703884 RepID=A0A848MPA2_9GAMM|nr:BMC domain-containing protein [Rouxiella aceris]